jgi:hypothetical protein
MMDVSASSISSPVSSLGRSKANCSREQWSRRASHVCCQVISDRSRNEANIGLDHPCYVLDLPNALALCMQRARSGRVYLRRVNKRPRHCRLEQPRPTPGHGTWWDVLRCPLHRSRHFHFNLNFRTYMYIAWSKLAGKIADSTSLDDRCSMCSTCCMFYGNASNLSESKIRAAEQLIPDLVAFLLDILLSQSRWQYHPGTPLVHVPTMFTSVAYAGKAPEAEENDGISGDLVQKIS